MEQMKLCKNDKLLKLDVKPGGVTCLNGDEFPECDTKLWHIGLDSDILESPDNAIGEFKKFYNTDNIQIMNVEDPWKYEEKK